MTPIAARLRLRRFFAALAIVGAALGAFSPVQPAAQSAPETDAETPVGEAEWRALTRGKTLVYTYRGALVGREYFAPDSETAAVFVYADGSCYDGVWYMRGELFCFEYQDRFCFMHFRRDGALWARDAATGLEQRIVQILDDAPLSCRAPLSS